ncbi:MAG TPA: 50S ribosomal protein L18 [Candidatus Bilamarchaeaceae archaeon]|nr:50S ribosomal protein L18 [Candidatus Bilamarchaeaceae archaeon]
MSRAVNAIYRVSFRRRREGRTNYARRLALIQSGKTRLVVRKTNKNIIVQLIDTGPKGDVTRVTVLSSVLKKMGWEPRRNAATAYLTGWYAARLARDKSIQEFVLDIGLHTPSNGSIVFAAAKGALDAGLRSSYQGEKAPGQKIDALAADAKQRFEEVKEKIGKGKHT